MTMTDYASAAGALLLVIGLIALAAWILKKMMQGSSGLGFAGGRQRRLGLVETTALDASRKLVLIRRDNVEHLLLVSQDRAMVVETGITGEAQKVEQSSTPAPEKTAQAPAQKPSPRLVRDDSGGSE